MNKELIELKTSSLSGTTVKDKMSCIVLYGEKNCGKTSTLSHLIVLLTGGGAFNANIARAFERKFPANNGFYPDSHHIIHYKRNGDGKEACIYVSTNGDTWTVVENNFKFFYGICKGNIEVHQFNGTEFVKCEPLNRWNPPCPLFCISPANFHDGAIQAEHYYLSNTCFDWKRQLWILKEKKDKEYIGEALPKYEAGIIKRSHAEVAEKIVEVIDRMIDETII